MKLTVFCFALEFLILQCGCFTPFGAVSEEQYNQLPPKWQRDNYDSCKVRPDSVYCYGTFVLDVPTSSHLRSTLEKLQDNPFIFNHSRIHRGLCMSHKNTSSGCVVDPSVSFEESFEICVNKPLKEEYGVNAKILNANCDIKDKIYPKDKYYYLFFVFLLTIFCLNATATWCDDGHGGFDNHRVLMCFSLRRNWERLTRPEKDIDAHHCLNGMKALNAMIVVTLHCVMAVIASGITNPWIVDVNMFGPDFGINTNGFVLVQTFVIISSFLRIEKTFKEVNKSTTSYRIVFKAAIDRYVRTTPIFFVTAWFSATVYPHLGAGPVWSGLIAPDSEACRASWWRIPLLVHSLSCLIPSWYCRLDICLYIITTLISVYLVKNKERCLRILANLLLASLVLLFAINYYYGYRPAIFLSLEYTDPMDSYVICDSFAYLYTTPWGSLPSAIVGMMWYCIYRQLKKQREQLQHNKTFLAVSRSCLLIAPWYAHIVYLVVTRLTSFSLLSVALTATFEKIGYAIVSAGYLTACMLKVDRWQPWFRFLNWPGWIMISRLSLASLLLHLPILHIKNSDKMYPERLSILGQTVDAFGLLLMTFVCSVLAVLLIELPAAQLYKTLTSSAEKRKKKLSSEDNAKNIKQL